MEAIQHWAPLATALYLLLSIPFINVKTAVHKLMYRGVPMILALLLAAPYFVKVVN